MDGNVTPFPPRTARPATDVMAFSDRLRLCGLQGELAMAHLTVVRASTDFVHTGSEVDREVAVKACAAAIEALQGIALLIAAGPVPTEPDAA